MSGRREGKPFENVRAQGFFQQTAKGGPVSVASLIKQGYNYYGAWMKVLGLSPLTIAQRMDLDGYIGKISWPGFEKPTAVEYLGYVCDEGIDVDAEFMKRFAKAIGQPVMALAPAQNPQAPASSEIVEAAMQQFEGYIYNGIASRIALDRVTGQQIPEDLSRFLSDECKKAEQLGDLCQSGHGTTNRDYLRQIEDSPVSTRLQPSNDRLILTLKMMASPAHVLHLLEKRVGLFEEVLKNDVNEYSQRVVRYKNYWARLNEDLWTCVRALAPHGQHAEWMQAYDLCVAKETAAIAKKILMEDPESIYPLSDGWESKLVRLKNGLNCSGQGILKFTGEEHQRFCDADKALKKVTNAKYDNVDALFNYRQWRNSPETALFLKAEANSRHIRYYINACNRAIPNAGQAPARPIPMPMALRSGPNA